MTDQEDKLPIELQQKVKEVESDLKKVEKFIYDLETEYLNSTANSGNIIRGWDHIFTSKPKISSSNQYISNLTKKIKITPSERIFTMTSKGAMEADHIINRNHVNSNVNLNMPMTPKSSEYKIKINLKKKKKMLSLKNKKKSNDNIEIR